MSLTPQAGLHARGRSAAGGRAQALDRSDSSTLVVTQEALSQALGVRRTTLTLIACKFRDLDVIR
jgi:hypothetical protein